MTSRKRGSGLQQISMGLLMMAAGVVLLLDQRGVIEVGAVGHWWAAAIVVTGFWKMTAPEEDRDVAGGAMYVILGAWLLACSLDWMGLTYRNSWPLVFVAIGVKMVIKAMTPVRPVNGPDGGKESSHA